MWIEEHNPRPFFMKTLSILPRSQVIIVLICTKETVCSCISTFVSFFFVMRVEKVCQICIKNIHLYEHYKKTKKTRSSTDELYSVHCVHIPSILTSCQFWPI